MSDGGVSIGSSARNGAVIRWALIAVGGFVGFHYAADLSARTLTVVASQMDASGASISAQAFTFYALFYLVPLAALLGVFYLTRGVADMTWVIRGVALIVIAEFTPSDEIVSVATEPAIAAQVSRMAAVELWLMVIGVGAYLVFALMRWFVRDERRARQN